jgi:chlorophyll/bacteriochlorophyll a synthase
MWAYLCGAVSAGLFASSLHQDRLLPVVAGIILAGPLVCGTSQAVNDWFDRHVDAINEPDRVIPSGRMPGRWGLAVAIIGTGVSMAWAAALGAAVFVATLIGLAAAWAYSAPPLRLKLNGWFGNGAVGFSYESLPWFTVVAVVLGGNPAIKGDRELGVRSLPVQLGPTGAAWWTAISMLGAQAAVLGLLWHWDKPVQAAIVAAIMLGQAVLLARFIARPVERALGVSAFGVSLYVTGMMAAATALPSIIQSGVIPGATP